MEMMRNKGETPGPGTYDQASTVLSQSSARVVIGSSKRDQLNQSLYTPGPGAYALNTSVISEIKNLPKWGFGTAQRKDLNATFHGLPGPGSYNLNTSFDENKGPVMVSRRPDSAMLIAAKVPGPGTYDSNPVTKKRAPAFRIGSAARSPSPKKQTTVPGPGNYEPKLLDKICNTTIGNSKRRPLNETTATPGPGSYEYRLSTNEGPKYVMAPRRSSVSEMQKDRDGPGPGAYELSYDTVKSSNPKFGIGTATREGFYKSGAIPGPGSYDTRGQVEGPKWGFGSERRSRSVNQSLEPGPGAYNIPPKFADAPSYALK